MWIAPTTRSTRGVANTLTLLGALKNSIVGMENLHPSHNLFAVLMHLMSITHH